MLLWPSLHFLPKEVFTFHVAQDIVLPVFFPHPDRESETALQSLDIKSALLFYLDRTGSFRKHKRLFVCFAEAPKGHAASSQIISRWVVSTI